MKKILIFGYYGEGNLGDDLILEVLKNFFSPEFVVGVLSSHYYEDIKYFQRFNLRDIFKAINWADIVIGGGGGVLQDRTSFKSILYYLFIIWLSIFKRKKVYLIGQSFTPFKYSISKFLVRKTLSHCEKIYVRDRFSEKFLNHLGISKEKMYLIPDLVFLKDISEAFSERKYIGVNLRPWQNLDLSKIEKILEFLKNEGKIIFFSFQDSQDLKLFDKLSEKIKKDIVKISTNSQDFWEKFLSCKYFVGMRLHSLILSTIAGIPFLGISYDNKIEAYLSDISWKYFLPVEELDKFKLLWTQLIQDQELEGFLSVKSKELKEELYKKLLDLKRAL